MYAADGHEHNLFSCRQTSDMQVIRQKGFLRGLHVYKIEVRPGDKFTTSLDLFWMNEAPMRYSIACNDVLGRKVGHLGFETEQSLRPMMEFDGDPASGPAATFNQNKL